MTLLLVVAVSCSSADDASPAVDDTAPAASTTEAVPEATSESTTGATRPTTGTSATSTPETIAPVPETGVPGIDSDDPFCNAWSRFAGSFQALAFASNLGDPDDAIELEVVASDAVVAAVADLDEALPSEVAGERTDFIEELLGPFTARAATARDALLAAGLSTEQVSALGEAWIAAVSDAGFNDLELSVEISSEVQGPFDVAVATFEATSPPIAADPALVTEASAPATEAYIAANCPDQGILAGNDVVAD